MQASTSKRGVWLEIAPTRRQQENDTLETMTGATLQSSGMMSWPTAVFWSKAAVTAIWWPAAQHFFIVQEWGRHQELIFRYFFFISCHSSFFENYLMWAARFFEKLVTMMQSDTHCLKEQNKMEIAMSCFNGQLWPGWLSNAIYFSACWLQQEQFWWVVHYNMIDNMSCRLFQAVGLKNVILVMFKTSMSRLVPSVLCQW